MHINSDSGQAILVSGGMGFIGSKVIQSLVLEGIHVVCVDDLSSGLDQSRFVEGVTYILGSIEDKIDLRKA